MNEKPASNYMDIRAWKKKAAETDNPPKALLRKVYQGEIKQSEEDDNKVTFIISTASPDRHGDVVEVGGWDLSKFLHGGPGPVLFSHDYSAPPVGKSSNVFVRAEEGKDPVLMADVEWVPLGVFPLADTVREMVNLGFLKSTSVGFMPKEWNFIGESFAVHFEKQELMEFSIVPVPANPEAVIQSRSCSIDLGAMEEWMLETLRWFPSREIVSCQQANFVAGVCGMEKKDFWNLDFDLFRKKFAFLDENKNLEADEPESGDEVAKARQPDRQSGDPVSNLNDETAGQISEEDNDEFMELASALDEGIEDEEDEFIEIGEDEFEALVKEAVASSLEEILAKRC